MVHSILGLLKLKCCLWVLDFKVSRLQAPADAFIWLHTAGDWAAEHLRGEEFEFFGV